MVNELCSLFRIGLILIAVGGGMWLGQRIKGPVGAIIGAIVAFLLSSKLLENFNC